MECEILKSDTHQQVTPDQAPRGWMRQLLPLGLLLGLAQWPLTSWSALQAEAVEYQADGVTMNGWLAWDDSTTDQRPGVLVVHEWWGHNDYARRRAEDLAKLGYTALALDMYGDGKLAEHPDDAGKFARAVSQNMESAKARFEAALGVLNQHATVNPEQTAALGYCFGGSVVLNMARLGVDLDVVGSFHGGLGGVKAGDADKVQGRVAIYNGASDPFVTQEQIDQVTQALDSAQVDYQFINYPGVVHSFTNPGATKVGEQFNLPLRYDALADDSSWQHFQLLLRDTFQP